jgi:hypothetical protein
MIETTMNCLRVYRRQYEMYLDDICLTKLYGTRFSRPREHFRSRATFYDAAYQLRDKVGILDRWLFEVEEKNCFRQPMESGSVLGQMAPHVHIVLWL